MLIAWWLFIHWTISFCHEIKTICTNFSSLYLKWLYTEEMLSPMWNIFAPSPPCEMCQNVMLAKYQSWLAALLGILPLSDYQLCGGLVLIIVFLKYPPLEIVVSVNLVTEVCTASFRSSVVWGLALIILFLKFCLLEESHGFKFGDRGHYSEPPWRTWYLFPNVSFKNATQYGPHEALWHLVGAIPYWYWHLLMRRGSKSWVYWWVSSMTFRILK
jgi:hypothetical protein